LADAGRLEEALECCRKAISAEKLNPSLHYLQANILQEMGRTVEAAASLRRAIFIDRDFVLAHFSLGRLLQRMGRGREAGVYFNNASSLLRTYRAEDVLPESDGISAGRLLEMIRTMWSETVMG
jgi:chemotaxis protein methyltransferase CheR